jgi:HEAT repeat protein
MRELPRDPIGQEPTAEDPHKAVRDRLAQFILSLIQAFLRTGYYTPDHPESKKARVGLYDEFQGLFIQKDELAFLVHDDPKGKNILIEGVLQETQYLDRILLRGMAEMYIPRFAGFLERKDLISLTLKQTMSRTEFTHFVNVMSESSFVDTRKRNDKERFSQTLRKRGIFNISYVFNEELVATKRGISWRAQLALSRLKKDLKMIPLFLDLDMEGLKKVRGEIIQDVTRPIRSNEAIYHVLMNSDLAETEELKQTEINKQILASLSDHILLRTSQKFLEEALEHGMTDSLRGNFVKLIQQIGSSLKRKEIEGGETVLEAYFKNGLIPFEQLSETTQHKISLERLTSKFLRYSHSFFERFDQVDDKKRYLHLARSFTTLIPELIRRDRYDEILKIITHIDRHFNEKKHLSIYAGQVLEEIGRDEIPGALKEKFLTEKKEIRLAISPIFLKLHVGSVPYLLSILKESDDQWVRKHACEILVRIGSSAINFILLELNKKEIGIEPTIDIIRVLGEIKSDEWIQPLSQTLRSYLNHQDPHLREEALGAYDRILGGEDQEPYLALLNDPALAVRKRAIQCLARIQSEIALGKFLEILQEIEALPSETDQPLEARIFAALGLYENVELQGIGRLEDFLLETLDRRLSVGALQFLKKRKNPLSGEAVAAICESLGNIGTRKSLPALEKLEKQHETLWKNKAGEALKKIHDREDSIIRPKHLETPGLSETQE